MGALTHLMKVGSLRPEAFEGALQRGQRWLDIMTPSASCSQRSCRRHRRNDRETTQHRSIMARGTPSSRDGRRGVWSPTVLISRQTGDCMRSSRNADQCGSQSAICGPRPRRQRPSRSHRCLERVARIADLDFFHLPRRRGQRTDGARATFGVLKLTGLENHARIWQCMSRCFSYPSQPSPTATIAACSRLRARAALTFFGRGLLAVTQQYYEPQARSRLRSTLRLPRAQCVRAALLTQITSGRKARGLRPTP